MTLLPEKFFQRATVEVARDLLGATLGVRTSDGLWTAGRIVETEAYGGEDDPASHAGRGRTPRSEIMFGPPGRAYVYLVYGVHHCLNFVTEPDGSAGAVLIRALEPLEGQAIMAHRRGLDPTPQNRLTLCSGPGRLCQALAVDLTWNGTPLTFEHPQEPNDGSRLLTITPAPTPVTVTTTPRIGISQAPNRLHRFTESTNPHVSR